MTEFTDFLIEAFAEFGTVSARKMFGGHGIFHDGVMIGLVGSDTLYLKVDKQSEPEFIAAGLTQFKYGKGDKQVGMSYYTAPAEALEDPDAMREWAHKAYAAALRSKK